MTERRRCRWCRQRLPEGSGRGRRREFCSQRCRQWEWVSRQRAGVLELGDDEVVLARSAVEELHDELYAMTCAVEDTDADFVAAGGDPSPAEVRRMLDWLLDAARPLATRRLPAPSRRA